MSDLPQPRPFETIGALLPTAELACSNAAGMHESAAGGSLSVAAEPADDYRALERRRLIDALLPLRKAGKSFAECATVLGTPAPTLWRLERAWKAEGDAGLKTKHANCGRKKLASFAIFGPEAIAFVKRLQIQTESLPLALERLSDAGPCSPAARDLIDKYRASGDYPPSFYQLFRVTAEEWALAKGEKTFDGTTHTARRGMWYLDEEGRKIELFAGDLVEADDVSIDCPYYVQLPDGSYSVGRQVLCFRDRRSRKWLGAYAVARERDSYRGEDIARACRELTEAWGLVGRFRFERGSWESQAVEGIKVDDGKGGTTKWGGISSLIPVDHVFTSRGKGTIEGGFRMLHKVLGQYGVRIGKTRGEYEQATDDMLAVNEGRKTPQQCGFIAFADLLAVFERAFTQLNTRPVFFQELGRKVAPDDAWSQDMAARAGGRLPACAAELLWHFLPVKREVGASIAQAGHVKVSVEGYPLPYFFRIGGPGLVYSGKGVGPEGIERDMPFLERGHRLIVAFDPQRAAEGAVIFNAERGPRNTQGWRPFEKLLLAPLASEAPQYSLQKGGARGSDDQVAKQKRDNQVRAGFASIGLYGQGGRRIRQDHDGRGNIARVESGAAARTTAPVVPVEQPIARISSVTTAPAQAAQNRCKAPAQPLQVEDFTLATHPRAAAPVPAPFVEDW